MKRRDEVLVGIFVTVAVAVLIIGTIWLTRGGLSRGYSLYTRFLWGQALKVRREAKREKLSNRFFFQREGKPFSVRQADSWLQAIIGLKVPCVQAVRWYGLKYPDMLQGAGVESVPCTWTTVNAFCQVLCERGILAYSRPDRDSEGQLLVFRPKDRTEGVSQAAGRIG